MKLNELLKLHLIEKISDNEYKCLDCNNTYTKMGVINHHFYEHEEEGIKKKKEIAQKAITNNNTPEMKKKISEKTKEAFKREDVKKNLKKYVEREKIERTGEGNPMYGKTHTEEWKNNHSNLMTGFKHSEETKQLLVEINTGKKHSKESIKKMRLAKIGKKLNHITRQKMSLSQLSCYNDRNTLTIEKINELYPFFSKVEEIRYNPDKPEEKEIQVHCKNHNCPNSKEKGGWFTPNKRHLRDRIYAIEKTNGNDGNYLYCSEECKTVCPLFGLNPSYEINKNYEITYTPGEYQTFRKFVLERDEYKCQYCGEKATNVHHERVQKLEPFFSLDPDFAWSCCKKCHCQKGHQEECSTGKLANQICLEK